nr:glycosyltransferase family A protein [Roseococcus sp. SDR]
MPPLTICLTSIRSRIAHVDRVVHSLLAQTPAPDHIMLVLSQEPYLLDEGVDPDALPPALRQLSAEGRLELVLAPNTGPYRKLLPALHRFAGQERLIVTVDDDIVYPPHWLAGLVETYRRRRCVVAWRCRGIAVAEGRFQPYSRWRLLPAEGDAFGELPPKLHGLFTIGTGFHGVLYDTRFFTDLPLLEELRELAPRQDDLAFKAATMCAGIPTALVESDLPRLSFGRRLGEPGAEAESGTLFHLNKKQNDGAWGRLMSRLEARGLFRLSDVLAGSAP